MSIGNRDLVLPHAATQGLFCSSHSHLVGDTNSSQLRIHTDTVDTHCQSQCVPSTPARPRPLLFFPKEAVLTAVGESVRGKKNKSAKRRENRQGRVALGMGPFGRLVALGTVAALALLAALSVSLLAPDDGTGKAGLPQPTELCDATGIEGCQPVKHFDAKSLYKDEAAIDQGHPNRIDFYGQLFQSFPAGTDTTLQKVRL